MVGGSQIFFLSGPEFVDKCNLDKLAEDEWDYLLYHRPEFAKQRRDTSG